MNNKRIRTIVGIALIAATASQAGLPDGTTIEDYLPVIGEGTIDTGTEVFTFDSIDEFEVEETKYKLKGELESTVPGGTITLQELEFDPDPLVTAKMLVYNTTAGTQTFSLFVTQPAFLNTSSSQVRGSVVISLLDDEANGAEFSTSGTDPVYRAYIDGVEVESLVDPAFSLTTTPTNFVTSAQEEFGWDPYGAGVTTDIAIELRFDLSPGDTATVTSRFEVIPEPGTILLVSFSTLGMIVIKRRFSV